jgi:phosphoribosylformylglycinamidine synthase
LALLSSYNVCSKEWVIRQYDHEVQGGSVIKPLVGVRDDGPGDAAVLLPLPSVRAAKTPEEAWVGLAVGCGLCPGYGDLDPYAMALAAIDEAMRNVVAVGADPTRIALLDNFCWGNCDRPEVLGSLVRRGLSGWSARLRRAVHQRQGQPEQRIPRRRDAHRHSADVAH